MFVSMPVQVCVCGMCVHMYNSLTFRPAECWQCLTGAVADLVTGIRFRRLSETGEYFGEQLQAWEMWPSPPLGKASGE